VAGATEAPKARNAEAWANGPGNDSSQLSFRPQRGEIFATSIQFIETMSLLQSFNLFWGLLPGALPQAFAFRAFGALGSAARRT